MPYTVTASFDTFYNNINLPGDHREIANTRRDHIISLIENNFDVVESFATGSIPRFTALKNDADLDVVIALHYGKHIHNKKPSEVLQSIRDVLGEYKTNVRKNGQAVTLYYQTWPNVDIVPVSRLIDKNSNITGYKIPDMNNEEWISSNPQKHNSNILNKSSRCGPLFRKIITMIKHWNNYHGSYLQSYHIEVLAINIYDSYLDDITWDIQTFFSKSIELINSYLWYEGSFVDDYLTYDAKNEIIKRLQNAYEKSCDAWYRTYNTRDDHKAAIAIWRQIFGGQFPSYG